MQAQAKPAQPEAKKEAQKPVQKAAQAAAKKPAAPQPKSLADTATTKKESIKRGKKDKAAAKAKEEPEAAPSDHDSKDPTTPSKEAFSELDELNAFGAEEDSAISGILDGEAMVADIGKSLGRDIKPYVKNGTPKWVK